MKSIVQQICNDSMLKLMTIKILDINWRIL